MNNSDNLSTLSVDMSGKLVETMDLGGQTLRTIINFMSEYKIDNVWKRKEDRVTFGYDPKFVNPRLGW